MMKNVVMVSFLRCRGKLRIRMWLLLLLFVDGEEVCDRVVRHRLKDDWRFGLAGEYWLVFLVDVMSEFELTQRHRFF